MQRTAQRHSARPKRQRTRFLSPPNPSHRRNQSLPIYLKRAWTRGYPSPDVDTTHDTTMEPVTKYKTDVQPPHIRIFNLPPHFFTFFRRKKETKKYTDRVPLKQSLVPTLECVGFFPPLVVGAAILNPCTRQEASPTEAATKICTPTTRRQYLQWRTVFIKIGLYGPHTENTIITEWCRFPVRNP